MIDWINNPEKHKNIAYLLSLLSAVINEKEPNEPDFQPDWEFIYNFAKSHSVDNTVFYAVEKLENKPEAKLLKKWMNKRNKCIHRNMIQRQEYEEICSAFEENAIDYMPVKGFYISELYPIEGGRFMGDIDILIKDRREDAVQIVIEKGYSLKEKGVDYDKPLEKPPFMMIELHNSLFPLYFPYRTYFEDIFSRCTQKGHYFKMSSEDFYIYEVAHLYKHYFCNGTGIRSIIDFYLINKKILPNLDRKIVESRLSELNMNKYSREIDGLAKKWFEREDYSSFSEMEMYVLSSGIFGTRKNYINNKIDGKSKSQYIKERLFPSKNVMYEFFPKSKKHPWLLPVFYSFRLFKGIFTKRLAIKNEYKIINSKRLE